MGLNYFTHILFTSLFIGYALGTSCFKENSSFDDASSNCINIDVKPVKELETGIKDNDGRFVLEEYTTFSECHLWKLMMSFYDRQGVKSWSDGTVPNFVTSNGYIANSYVKVLLGLLQDGTAPGASMPIDPNEPLYIVELGTGPGLFSNYFIKLLLENEKLLPFPMKNIKYIMTDFTENNFKTWGNHPALKQHVEDGLIDFAIFDGVKDIEMTLHNSKVVLKSNSLKNPIVIIANYIFDTLYHDHFQVEDGILKETLISVGSKSNGESDPLDPTIIQRLWNKYEFRPINESYYLDDEEDVQILTNILEWYRDYYKTTKTGGSFLLPIGGLRAVRRLTAMSSRRALLISADKAFDKADYFLGIREPHIAIHGSFSVMVNLHAMGLYFTQLGGFALHDSLKAAQYIKTSVFIMNGDIPQSNSIGSVKNDQELHELMDQRSDSYPNLKEKYMTHIFHFTPDDFHTVLLSMVPSQSKTFQSVLAYLKLSNWDPMSFYMLREFLQEKFTSALHYEQLQLIEGLDRLWNNYFHLSSFVDIPYELGMLYAKHGNFDKAIELYEYSIKHYGKSKERILSLGLAIYHRADRKRSIDLDHKIKEWEKSMDYFKESIEIDPDYELGKNVLDDLVSQIVKEIQTHQKTEL